MYCQYSTRGGVGVISLTFKACWTRITHTVEAGKSNVPGYFMLQELLLTPVELVHLSQVQRLKVYKYLFSLSCF